MRKFAAGLLTLSLFAGCGGDENNKTETQGNTPAAKALLQESFKNSRNQHQFKFGADLTLDIDSSSQSPELQRVSGDPIKLKLAGGYQKTPPVLDLRGSAYYLGQTFTAALLAGDREAYFQLLGKWYGTKDSGLTTFKQSLEQNKEAQQRAESQFFASFDRVFKGEVVEGPKLEGKDTWQIAGSLDPEAVIEELEKAAREVPASDGPPPPGDPVDPSSGVPDANQTPQDTPRPLLSEEEKQGIRSALKLLTISYTADKKDKLFRELRVEFLANKAELQELAKNPDFKQAGELDSLKVSLVFKVSNYGQPVDFKPPAQFQPLGDLLGEDSLEGFNPLNILGFGSAPQTPTTPEAGQGAIPPAEDNGQATPGQEVPNPSEVPPPVTEEQMAPPQTPVPAVP